MVHKFNRMWMLALIVLPLVLLVGSCGDDDDDDITNPPVDQADLVVDSITWTPASPEPGDDVVLTIVVRNSGDADAGSSSTKVEVNDQVTCASIPTPAIVSGSTASVTCEISDAPAGTHSIEACADSGNQVEESSEQNNCKTASLVIQEPGTSPNLAIQSITFAPVNPTIEDPVTATITVINNGDGTAAASETAVTLDGMPTCASLPTIVLNPGQTVALTCNLGQLAAGSYTVGGCADNTDVVTESNENDNCDDATLVVGDVGIIPEIPEAEIVQEVEFGSTDQAAQEAQGIVEGMLQSAAGISGMGDPWITPLEDAEWELEGGCQSWEYTEEGCTSKYTVCEEGGDLEWTITLTGNCFPGEDPVENWVALRGTSNADGTEGSFYIYEYGGTAVEFAWIWDVAADGKSGSWTFYQGEPMPGHIIAAMSWEEFQDGSQHVEWTMPEMMRWTVDVNAAGTEGHMKNYNWNDTTEEWVLFWEIIWHTDGSGSNTMYDEEGTVLNEETW